MIAAALAGLLALILGALATAMYLPLARRMAWLDTPGQRSAHQTPTPGSGGLALIPALFLALGLQLALAYLHLGVAEWRALGAVAAVCILGAWDDRRPLSVRLRLAVQFLLAAWVVQGYGLFDTGLLRAIVLLVGLVWLVNLFNFMDGIDGIAALQCALTAGALTALSYLAGADGSFLMVAASVAGLYLGFLIFNWPPARLFMGDAGSLSGGLLLGWLGLWGWLAGWVPAECWLLLMSPFLMDTGITLIRRFLRRERLGEAHKGHYYQRLARHWGRPVAVDRGLLLLQVFWLFPLALAAAQGWAPPWTLLVAGLFPQLVLMAKWHALE